MHNRTYLLPLVALSLLAGCGDSESSSSTTTSAPPSVPSTTVAVTTTAAATTTSASGTAAATPAAGVDPKHLCTVLTVADMNKVLNGAIATTNAPTDEDSCVYYTKAGSSAGRAQGDLTVTLTGAKAKWDAGDNIGTQPVAGVGDKAFSYKTGDLLHVEALKGDTEVDLAVGNGVTATEEQLKTLVGLAFQRLGV